MFVYVIASETASKVGISGNVASRLSALRSQTTTELRLVETFPFDSAPEARDVEAQCHRILGPYRLAGTEWFACDPERCVEVLRGLQPSKGRRPTDSRRICVLSDESRALAAAVSGARAWGRRSQADVARESGLAQQSVSDLETGRRGLDMTEVPSLAKALKMEPTKLFKLFLTHLDS